MINDVDFIYDYSDLNRMNIRTKFLTGQFAGIVLEYTNIWFENRPDGNDFTFDYLFFHIPKELNVVYEPTFEELKKHMGHVLVDIIIHRKSNPNDWKRLIRANKVDGRRFCKIKIDDKYYKKNKDEQK
jgi:hypothetical protein